MGNVLTIYNARDYIFRYVDNEEDFCWITMSVHLWNGCKWTGEASLMMRRSLQSARECLRTCMTR